MKEKLKLYLPAIVLTSICIVVALVLALTNMFTEKVIEENRQAALAESLKEVAPDPDNFKPVEVTDKFTATMTDSAKAIYVDEVSGAYAVVVERQGYASVIKMTVGISADGAVNKVVITEQQESHGKPDVAKLPDKFIGVTDATVGDVETVSGATVTSTAIKNGVTDALISLGLAEEKEETLPRTDEELKTLAKALLAGSTEMEFIEFTPDEDGYVKRILRDKGGKGYVAYVNVYYYGNLSNETLIAFDTAKNITGVNKLLWAVGHSTEYGPPAPADEVVDAFFQSFVGKSGSEIASVELVTNATGTAELVRDAIVAAANALPIDNELMADAMTLLPGATGFTSVEFKDDTGSVQKVYRENGGKGYAAYVHVFYHGSLVNETLIAFDASGKITGVKAYSWSVGHSTEYGPPAPSVETVNAFFQSFVGKSGSEIASVELVTNATGTSELVRDAIVAASNVATLESIASEILPGAGEFEEIEFVDETGYVQKIFRDKNGNGHVAYVNVYYYGRLANETLIAFDNDKNIVGIKNLGWAVGHSTEYGPPAPSDEVVEAFFQSFVGKSAEEISSVELVTNATGTAELVREAIVAACAATPDESFPIARFIGIMAIALAVIASTAFIIVYKRKRRIAK